MEDGKPRIKGKLPRHLRLVAPHPRQTPLTNVPGMLRSLAAQMESGKLSTPQRIVWISHEQDGTYGVGLMGEYMPMQGALGIIHCGAFELVQMLSNGQPLHRRSADDDEPDDAA